MMLVGAPALCSVEVLGRDAASVGGYLRGGNVMLGLHSVQDLVTSVRAI